jgi:hypothetical protein
MFEPSSILALLASLELKKDQKDFRKKWKTKVSISLGGNGPGHSPIQIYEGSEQS